MRERKRRGHSRYYLFFLVAFFALSIISGGVYYLLTNLSYLDLRTIEITGNHAIPDSLIHSKVDQYLGYNLLKIPKSEIKDNLRNLSRIKEVKIKRSLLHTLKIHVTERNGALYLQTKEGVLIPVDTDGVVLARYSPVLNEDLPVMQTYLRQSQLKAGQKLKFPVIQRVLSLHKQIVHEYPEFLTRVSEYYVIDNTVYIVDSETGTRVVPSTDNLKAQLKRYLFVQDNGNIGSRKLVDLRFENQVVVKADTQ